MPRHVVIYTRPGSMLGSQVEAMLTGAGVPFHRVEYAARDEQDALLAIHRAPGFPLVVVDGRYVGGFPEIVELHAGGRLPQLLEADPGELRRALVSATQTIWTTPRSTPPRRPSSGSFVAVRPPGTPSVAPPAARTSTPPAGRPTGTTTTTSTLPPAAARDPRRR